MWARRLAAQSFLDGVLHEYGDELGHPRVLVPRRFGEYGFVHFVRAGPVGVLVRELVGDPIELLVENLATQFLTHWHPHWHLHKSPRADPPTPFR
jgi:hypothetical protein